MPTDDIKKKKEEVAKQEEKATIEDVKTKWKRRGKKLV